MNAFNPVTWVQGLQDNLRRWDALADGNPGPMLDHLLAPFEAAANLRERWDNASEEERYYMASYGAGYVGTTAAITYVTGAAGSRFAGAAGELRIATRRAGAIDGLVGGGAGRMINLRWQDRIQAEYRMRGIDISFGSRELGGRGGGFRIGAGGRPEIHLRSDATFYELRHELYHLKDYQKLGHDAYYARSWIVREESVYAQFRARWGMMSQPERDAADRCIDFYRNKWWNEHH